MKPKFAMMGLLLLGLLMFVPTASATHVCSGGPSTYACYGVFPGFTPDQCTLVVATWTGVNNDGDWQDPGETLIAMHCVQL